MPEELAEELGSILMTLSFFSSREMAEGFHAEATTGTQPFEEMVDAIHRILQAEVAQ